MALTLEKEQAKVKLSLEKVTKKEVPPVQVKLIVDVSGSMSGHYDKNSGYMYPILQRAIALASIIDPDKVVQIIAFDTKAHELGDFGVDDFDGIWKEFDTNKFWGGTYYAAAFNKVLETRTPSVTQKAKGFFGKLFGKTETVQGTPSTSEPEMLIFLTDGADGGSDNEFITAYNQVLDANTYLMCIGAGGSEYCYGRLKKLADERDNVGYVYFKDTRNLSDDKFYETILSGEFGEWLEKFA